MLIPFMFNCSCPRPTALTTIPTQDCPFNIGQIQRLMFVRDNEVVFDEATPANNTPATIAGFLPSEKAGWDVLVAATDSTKVVKTPLIGGNPTITPGGAITSGGGDNSTLNGEVEVTGRNPSVFACEFKSLDVAIEKAIKELGCENLEVYFVAQDKSIYGVKNGDSVTGFPITSFFMDDRNNQGFGTKDMNALSFNLAPLWSDNLYKITPEAGFNPLTF